MSRALWMREAKRSRAVSMHRLIIMRHARAESASAPGGDRDRPLSDAGRAEAALMGRALAERGLRPDLVLVSGARRTRETWEQMRPLLAADGSDDAETRAEPGLYNASAAVLRGRIEAVENDAGCLLILAHNPGVHELAVEYLTEAAASPAMLDRMAGGFPPGSAAIFAADAAGRLTPESFLTPRMLEGLRGDKS